MLLIDDLLASPVNFVIWIMRQVQEAAEKELRDEADRIPVQLAELHRLLESEQITEQEFETREGELLDRLDELNQREPHPSAGGRAGGRKGV